MPLTVIWAAAIVLASLSFAAVAALLAAHAMRARARQFEEATQQRMSALCLDALAGGHGSLPQPRLKPREMIALLDVALHLSEILDGDAKARLWRLLAARRLGPALVDFAGDPTAERRLLAARALLAVAGLQQRDALQQLLADSDPSVAAQAAATLNDAGADPALAAILARLRAAGPTCAETPGEVLRLQFSRSL
jgi:hypothetical protein